MAFAVSVKHVTAGEPVLALDRDGACTHRLDDAALKDNHAMFLAAERDLAMQGSPQQARVPASFVFHVLSVGLVLAVGLVRRAGAGGRRGVDGWSRVEVGVREACADATGQGNGADP